jgi:hypothetical protein
MGMLNGGRPLGGMLQNNSALLTTLGASLIGGGGWNRGFQNFSQAAPMAVAADQKRATDQRQKAALNSFLQWKSAGGDPKQIGPWASDLDPAFAASQLFPTAPEGTDDMREYQKAVSQGFGGNFIDYMTKMKQAGATSVDVNNYPATAENAFAKELGGLNAKSFVEEGTAARSAADSLKSSEDARMLLDSGVVTGIGSGYILNLGKALQKVGFHESDDAIANTEAFVATRAQEVGRIIQLFGAGTGLSDADREFAKKAAAGDIELNEASIRRILDINDRAARNIIKNYNAKASKVDPALSPYPLTVEEPAAPPSPADVEAEMKRRGFIQ